MANAECNRASNRHGHPGLTPLWTSGGDCTSELSHLGAGERVVTELGNVDILSCQSMPASLECSFPAPPACRRWAEPAGEGQVLAAGIRSVGGEMGGAPAANTSPLRPVERQKCFL